MLNEHGIVLLPFCFSYGAVYERFSFDPRQGFPPFTCRGFFMVSYSTVENRKIPQKTPSMPLTFTVDLAMLCTHDAG